MIKILIALCFIVTSTFSCGTKPEPSLLQQEDETDSEYFSRIHKEQALTPFDQKTDPYSLQWFGVGSFYVNSTKGGILIDPYVSRIPLFSVLSDAKIKPDLEAVKKVWNKIPKPVNAIVITHSHYDHILDAASFADLCQCTVYGSESSKNVLASHGYSNFQVISEKKTFETAGFSVTPILSEHSKAASSAYSFSGVITQTFATPAPVSSYKLGKTFSLHFKNDEVSFVHHASAGMISEMYKGYEADYIFLGIARRPDTASFLRNTAIELDAKHIVPIHYDDFLMNYSQFAPLPSVNLKEFVSTLSTDFKDIKLSFMNSKEAFSFYKN